MSRYFFFLLRDGATIPDTEGDEFGTLDEARVEALMVAKELVASAISTGQPINGDQVEIRDEDGRYLDAVRLVDVIPLRGGPSGLA